MSAPAYDEDVITDLMNKIFDLYTKLNYFRPGDLVYPQSTSSGANDKDKPRHNFASEDRDKFAELELSQKVISLLERLPYLNPQRDSRSFPIYTYGCELSPPLHGYISDARDPHLDSDYPMLHTDMPIVITTVSNSFFLILDTEANTIRVFGRDEDWPNIPEDPNDQHRQDFEFPDMPEHYRNVDAEPAPAFLEKWIENIKKLDPMPFWPSEDAYQGYMLECPDFDFSKGITKDDLEMPPVTGMNEDEIAWECKQRKYLFLKYTLENEYEWPDNFDQERWDAEHWDVWRTAATRYDPDVFESANPRYGGGA